MERDALIRKVLARMDEVSHADSIDVLPNPTVSTLLEDGLDSFLLIIPTHLIKDHVISFQSYTQGVYEDLTTGYVVLPANYLKLVCFRLTSWQRPVIEAISVDNPLYQIQFNKVLKGSVSRPIVAIRYNHSLKANILEYFSTKNNIHSIAEANCVAKTTIEELQEDLTDAYAWYIASTALGVMQDTEGQKNAYNKFMEYLTMNSLNNTLQNSKQ